jgi:glutamine cyclotransferase
MNLQRPVATLLLVAGIVAGCGPTAVAVPTVDPTARPFRPAPTPTAAPALPVITPEAVISGASGGLSFDGKTIWLSRGPAGISRIDATSNSITAPIVIDPTWTWGGFRTNAAGLWLGDFDANLLYRIDPVSLAIVARIPIDANPDGLAVTVNAVWVAQHRGGSVTRIDPATNAAVTIKVGHAGNSGPHEVGIGAGSVWVSAGLTATDAGPGGAIVRIDPKTNRIQATIKIPASASACGGFAISETAVWMASCGDQPVLVRIDPETNQVVATIDLGGYGGTPVLVDGVPWLLVNETEEGADPARLVRVDRATNMVDGVFSLGETFKAENLLQAAGSVWTSDWANDTVVRIPLAAFAP